MVKSALHSLIFCVMVCTLQLYTMNIEYIREICKRTAESLANQYYLKDLYKIHFAVEVFIKQNENKKERFEADEALERIQAAMGTCFVERP